MKFELNQVKFPPEWYQCARELQKGHVLYSNLIAVFPNLEIAVLDPVRQKCPDAAP